jgi:calcium-dependent protein kinase
MRIFELLEDDIHYYIISELIEGGELYERICKSKVFTEKSAAQILEQILLAINYMHQRNITHRDIKPENILMQAGDSKSLLLKMTDFGFASFYNPKKGLDEVLGSPLYMAPEIINRQKYDSKVDIWSVGVIAFILISGRPPFMGKSKDEIF